MYKLNQFNGKIVSVNNVEQNISIPFAEDNTDYQAFLKYQAEGGKVYGADEEIPQGNTPLPADE